MPFALHAPLQTFCVLPLLLHAAGDLARGMLAAPLLREPVCVVASLLSLSSFRPDSCHPHAPQLVAYSVSDACFAGRAFNPQRAVFVLCVRR